MEFKVRWAGFGESCDTSKPYKALLHIDKLQDYLRTNAMEDPHPQGTQVERTENLFQDFPRNFVPPTGFSTMVFSG